MIRNSRNITALALPALILVLATGCLKNDWEENEENEKKLIQQYLSDNNISEDTKTEGGIYFVEEVAGSGLTPVKDDYVVINYVARYLEDEKIYETSYFDLKGEWEAANKFKYFLYGPVKFKYGYNIAGINEGLSLMKEGGKATIVIPSDKAFFDWKPLVYEIELIKVIRDPLVYEDSVLTAYLLEKKFSASEIKDSIWFREISGSDDLRYVQQNDSVLFRYKARLIDGFYPTLDSTRSFDGNMDATQPAKIKFDKTTTYSGLPKGFIMAIDSMQVGTRATAILPYRQAFGAAGIFDATYGYTIVPKFQSVIYDIQVENIVRPAAVK